MASDDEVKRAQANTHIARFKFANALTKQADAKAFVLPPVAQDECIRFYSALDAVLQQNTPANVQTCKKWIVKNIAPSKARIAALGDYLVAVSKAIVVDQKKSPKATRNRLDILLVVSDVLHSDKFHCHNRTGQGIVASELTPYIEVLVELAALSLSGTNSPNEKKLKAVINFWARSGCINANAFDSIRDRATEGLAVAQGGIPKRKRTYALPDQFGDRNAPWHELPVSLMLDSLIRYPDRPINPRDISVARLDRRQPSDRVRELLEEYFENIDLKYIPTGDNPTGETKKYKLWLDSMGQLVKQSKETGETKTVCNGYGWSMKFCEEMQDDGIPNQISEAREDYKNRMEFEEERRREPRSPPSNHSARQQSPRRRRYSDDSDEENRFRSHSSSPGSNSPYNRSRSRDRSRDKHHHRRRRSRDNSSEDTVPRRSRFDDRRESDRDNPPSEQYNRNTNFKQSRWNDGQNGQQDNTRSSFGGPANSNYSQNFGQHFPQGTPAFSHGPGFVPAPPPPVSGQYAGYPRQPFPPPPPPPPPMPFQGPVGAIPPPPPSNFNSSYPGAPPNMGAYQNNPYNYGNNAGYGNQGGYGGQRQGGFQGNFDGGFQGRGGYRGGYQGSQQGRGGSRWS